MLSGAYGNPPILDADEYKYEEGWGYNPPIDPDIFPNSIFYERRKVYGLLEKAEN